MAISDPYVALAEVLMDLECAMRRADIWQEEPPSPEALASTQPFGLDTLSLEQWLQFILLPRFYQLIEQRLPLPERCAVTPIAEETYRHQLPQLAPLLEQLRRLDRLFSE